MKRETVEKILVKIIKVISIIILMWLIMCHVEISIKNKAPNPSYSKYNVIVNIIDWASEGR